MMDSSNDKINAVKDSHVSKEDDTATENDFQAPSPLLSKKDSQSGIDIRQALDILSSRPSNDHTFRDGKPPPHQLKSMGQTIDLFATSSPNQADFPHSPSEPTSQTRTTGSTDSTSGKRDATSLEKRQKIRNSLKDHPFIGLLKMVLTAQEDRVRTYRLYDEALGKVLVSNRLTDYPPACVAATAAFSVLSDTVSAIREELSDRASKRNDPLVAASTSSSVINCIRDLQESEREKLQLTAAYHLERIRANNLKGLDSSNVHGHNADEDEIDVDVRELSMLKKGIAELRSRIETSRSNINSIIEDLRCALVEQMEKEEE